MKKIVFCLLLFFVSGANAQHWKGVGGGMDDGINCFYTDTFRHVLYAGGIFHHAGGVLGFHIAKWDGINWAGMPAGLPDDAASISADSNYIYAASGDIVYKYNGNTWIPLPAFSAHVNKVAVVNGELYAGGDFFYQDTTPVHHIAKWNGSSWDTLGPGIGQIGIPCYVDAITEYQGNLVVGGYFKLAGADTMNNLAMWDGSNWHSIGNGVFNPGGSGNSAVVYDLFADGNNLYVTGSFEFAGAFGGLTVNGIAMWDGTSWHNFGNGAFANGIPQDVDGVLIYNNEIFAVGGFSDDNLVKWDGVNWNSYYDSEFNSGGGCIAIYNNEFYVGSVSLTDTNGQVLNYIARRATFDINNDTVTCSSSCNGAATAAVLGVFTRYLFVEQWSHHTECNRFVRRN